jgi:predicted RecB family nuclease
MSPPQETAVLLGGYAAKQCARRVHNEWDTTIDVELVPVPPELQRRFDAGRLFEASVREALNGALGHRCVVIDEDLRAQAAIAQTVAAMSSGAEVVIGGWLPNDVDGGRKGRPDVLVRVSGPSASPAYVAGDIKGHLSTKPSVRGTWWYSMLAQPITVVEGGGRTARVADRFDDHVQLAHYARMLQACGYAPGDVPVTGFIIGTDSSPEPDQGAFALTWLDLEAPLFSTFSRTMGVRSRSALERYDHEHAFRLKVADIARRRMGDRSDPAPLVVPVITGECDVCPWREYCRDLLGPDAASAILEAGRLDVREWNALAGAGVETAGDLASLDLDDEDWWAGYLPEVTHQARARSRLTTAVGRARMALAGVRLERVTTGLIPVPRADVEIDFDIEWDIDDRVFLWGAVVTSADDPAGTYVDFTAVDPLDDETERYLAEQFLAWLRALVADAEAAGRSIALYHYSHPEPRYLARVLGEEEVADVLPLFIDLLPIVRAHYMGVAGLSIKQVAPEFGFHWRDEDPGGLQAQAWIQQAREAGPVERETLRRRVVEYNEDDVRATLAVRRGMASDASQPGERS